MRRQYTRLSSEVELRAARDAFHELFVTADTCGQPLRRPGTGLILADVRGVLSEEQYRVCADAAADEGDTDAYLSYLWGYQGNAGPNEELPSDFQTATHFRFGLDLYPPKHFGPDWIHIVEHTMYSVRGKWGIMMSLEWHAIAVGSDAFRSRLLGSPIFRDSLLRFLEYSKDERDRLQGTSSWIPSLLENVYGYEHAQQILVGFGEPRETWLRNG